MAALRNGRLLLSRNDDAKTDFIENVGRRYREYAHFRNVFMEAVGAERDRVLKGIADILEANAEMEKNLSSGKE
jgi:hypothetical protein